MKVKARIYDTSYGCDDGDWYSVLELKYENITLIIPYNGESDKQIILNLKKYISEDIYLSW